MKWSFSNIYLIYMIQDTALLQVLSTNIKFIILFRTVHVAYSMCVNLIIISFSAFMVLLAISSFHFFCLACNLELVCLSLYSSNLAWPIFIYKKKSMYQGNSSSCWFLGCWWIEKTSIVSFLQEVWIAHMHGWWKPLIKLVLIFFFFFE